MRNADIHRITNTHTKKPHKNTISETVIYKQKTSKVFKNAKTKQNETKKSSKYSEFIL